MRATNLDSPPPQPNHSRRKRDTEKQSPHVRLSFSGEADPESRSHVVMEIRGGTCRVNEAQPVSGKDVQGAPRADHRQRRKRKGPPGDVPRGL